MENSSIGNNNKLNSRMGNKTSTRMVRAAFYSILILSSLLILSIYTLGKADLINLNPSPASAEEQKDLKNIENNSQVLDLSDERKENENSSSSVTEISQIAEEIKSSGSSATSSSSSSTPTAPAKPPTTPVSPSGCPASTLNCVPCTTSDIRCRVEPGETNGFLGWSCQNNNPGNIRYSSARISYITKMGGPAPCGKRYDARNPSEEGTYMIFRTYQEGKNGLKAYMKAISTATHTAYSECADGNCSLTYVFSKYAPGDPNYAANIGQRLGVNPDTTSLQWVIANKFEALINAIQIKEGFFVQ